MKKLFLTAVLISGVAVSIVAKAGDKKSSSADNSNVSSIAIENFTSDFKNVKDAKWSDDGKCEKVEFKLGKTVYTAFYKFDGTFLGVTRDITIDKIPAEAKTEIQKEYKDYAIGEVIELKPNTNLTDVSDFGVSIPDEKVYFVDLKNDSKEFLLQVKTDATVSFFKQIK